MKITLDTNVLVSAFIAKHGHSARILDIILIFPEVRLILSKPMLKEFKDVLLREEVRERFGYSTKEIKSFAQVIRKISKRIKIKSHFKIIKEDPKDDFILNTAYDGEVDYIVSGNHHLQNLNKFKRIKIVSPKQMIKIIAEKFGEVIIPREKLETE